MTSLSGLFVGEITAAKDGSTKRLIWTLSLVAAPAPAPSAFGASFSADDDSSNLLLVGNWKPNSNTWLSGGKIELKEIKLDGSVCGEYKGDVMISADKSTVTILGKCNGGDDSFVTRREEEDAAAATTNHISGLWLGEAPPDEDLKAFLIPTNPIRWTMSLLLAPSGQETLFGAGYFADSGDIPGQSVLLFGMMNAKVDATSLQVEFDKVYEIHPETKDSTVHYSGTFLRNDRGQWSLQGNWKHENGSTRGTFFCNQQPSTSFSAAIRICDVCSNLIMPGSSRWTCLDSLDDFTCCQSCRPSDEVEKYPLKMAPLSIHPSDAAQGQCCAAIIADAFQRFAKRPCIGVRKGPDGFHWSTYEQVWRDIECMVEVISRRKVVDEAYCLLCADSSYELIVATLAAMVSGYIIVPVDSMLDEATLSIIIGQTRPILCFAQTSNKDKIKNVASIIVLNEEFTENIQKGSDLLVQQPEKKFQIKIDGVSPQDAVGVLYTSGSTGTPKGVVFTQDLLMPSEGIACIYPFVRCDFQRFDPTFSLCLLSTLQCGGSRGLSSNFETLFDDMKLIRPTNMGAPPLFWRSLYDEYQRALASETTKSSEDREFQAIKKIHNMTGGRIKVATSGGAACPQNVLQFFKTKMKIEMVELYGSRETGGITKDGIVYPQVDVKLLPVEGMPLDDNSEDKTRGEICISTPRLTPGYFGSASTTAEKFIEIQGKRYFRTGDIGELTLLPNGQRKLVIIDRQSAMVKLAQGEWISSCHVESMVENCPLVSLCYLRNHPPTASLIAVVTLSPLAIKKFGLGPIGTELSEDQRLIVSKEILQDIKLECTHRRLRSMEIPRFVFIDHNSWDKLGLANAGKKFRTKLSHRFAFLDELAEGKLSTSSSDKQQVVSDWFMSLLKQVFPGNELCLSDDDSFASIGGHSIAAARFINILKENNIQLTIAHLLDYPLSHVSNLIDLQKQGRIIPSAESEKIDWKSEISLTAYSFPDDAFPNVDRDAASSSGGGVLITGCTGFLGPFIVAECLKIFPKTTKLYCLLRASDQQSAERRFSEAMKLVNCNDDYDEEWKDRCVCVLGDVQLPRLGVAAEEWVKLLRETSHIIHSATWVHMTMPYQALRATNVLSTRWLIEFAKRTGASLTYVSTIGALAGTEEDWGNELTSQQLSLKGHYSQTKYVSERLLKSAVSLYNLDVRIVRPSTVTGHSQTGVSNPRDFISLLLSSFVTLGRCVELETNLNTIPVDVVASAVAVVSAAKRDQLPTLPIFNLVGKGPTLQLLISVLRSLGFSLKPVEASEWQRHVLTYLPSDHLGYPLREAIGAISVAAEQGQNEQNISVEKGKLWLTRQGVNWNNENTQETFVESFKYLKKTGFFSPN